MMEETNAPLVLVTGASGFLGGYVVRELMEAGHRVRGTVRDLKDEVKVGRLCDLCPQAKFKLEVVEADLCNPGSWAEAVKGCTYVHHIACPMPLESPKDENDIIKPCLEGTTSLLQACKDAKTVKRFILTGTLYAISSKGDNPTPFTEKDWQDEKMSGLPGYPRNKIMQERLAWDFVEKLSDEEKFELVVLNPGFLMGPIQFPVLSSSGNLLLRFVDGRMPAVPKFNFNLCDVRDCAKAHLKAMTCDNVAGHRHILSAGTMWLKDFGEVLSEELSSQGYKIPTKEIPNIFIAMAAKLDRDVSTVKFISATPINVDNSRQRQALQMEPIAKEETLIEMAHTMIELGVAKRTDEYKGRKSVQ